MGMKECRERAGLTPQEVAAALHVSVPAVWHWENGVHLPASKKLPQIANLYGCSIGDLLAAPARREAAQ